MVIGEVADQGTDARSDLHREVRRRGPDQGVDVLFRGLRHARDSIRSRTAYE
jgi:hypothetical protein